MGNRYLWLMSTNTQVALITGGNRGIGLAIARKMQSIGYQVVITQREGTGAEGFESVIMDVRDSESVNNAIAEVEKKYGQIDVLVANAGVTKDGLVMRMSDEDFSTVMDTNLMGAFRVARACTRGMMKRKSGRMIFIGSVVGMLGSAGQVNYAATKSGLMVMARSFARELGSRGICANVVAPGFVATDMTEVLDEARKTEIIKAVPLGRLASPDEIAGVVAFLASPEAAYISGAVIPVDGGLGMGH